MPRHRTPIRLLILFAVVGVAAALSLYMINRGPLAGPKHFDFGTVHYNLPPAVYEHTFTLTNRTSRTLSVNSIKTKCGCTAATTAASTIEPGQSFDVNARISFTRPGRKWEPIFIDLGEGQIVRLTVEIIAQQDQRLTSVMDSVALRAGETSRLVVFLLKFDTNDQPPPATTQVVPGVTARFVDWQQTQRRDRSEARPALWRGTIELDADEALALPEQAQMTVQVEDQKWTVKLLGE